jgi:hypothetical protein
MPIEHRVDKKTGIMHVRRWGEITTRDEQTALRKRRKDPLVVPGIPVIVDCTEIDPPDTPEVIYFIAARIWSLAAELDCGPVAIVVSSDVQYGMARMFMSLTELNHPATDVFRSHEAALEWLQQKADTGRLQSVDNL